MGVLPVQMKTIPAFELARRNHSLGEAVEIPEVGSENLFDNLPLEVVKGLRSIENPLERMAQAALAERQRQRVESGWITR